KLEMLLTMATTFTLTLFTKSEKTEFGVKSRETNPIMEKERVLRKPGLHVEGIFKFGSRFLGLFKRGHGPDHEPRGRMQRIDRDILLLLFPIGDLPVVEVPRRPLDLRSRLQEVVMGRGDGDRRHCLGRRRHGGNNRGGRPVDL
ncbi:hypothetical protein GW17_00033452, partial [Ensete ventricosum]